MWSTIKSIGKKLENNRDSLDMRLYVVNSESFKKTGTDVESGVFCDIIAYLQYENLVESSSIKDIVNLEELQEGSFLTYEQTASMINYLITTYGEDQIFSLYQSEKN